MKKGNVILGIALLLLVWVQIAGATTYSETFLGEKADCNYYDIKEGYKAEFGFNLTATGDEAKLYDDHGKVVQGSNQSPTADVTTFGAPQNIGSAFLNFAFSDKDTSQELVRVYAGINDGTKQIYEGWFDLGARGPGYYDRIWVPGYWECSGNKKHWVEGYYKQGKYHQGELTREYADLSIDLVALGLGSYLEDGKFLTLVLAPGLCGLDNNFRIDQANLLIDTTAVPEPATMLLLGLGLVGLAGVRRTFQK